MRKLIVPSTLAVMLLALAASAYAGGPGCSAGKSAAGKSCHYGQTAALPEGLKIETFRMPSGALAVFYTSDKADVVKAMQEKVAGGPENFSCGLCREMAKSKNCKIELVPFSSGVVAFITSEEPASLDAYEKQFAALTGAQTPANP